MKKNLKGLLCLWLAVAMLLTMMPITVMAEGEGSNSDEPDTKAILVWTSQEPAMDNGNVDDYSDNANVRPTTVMLNQSLESQLDNLMINSAGRSLIGWKLWKVISGNLLSSEQNLEINGYITDDLYENYNDSGAMNLPVLEPLWGYTVTVTNGTGSGGYASGATVTIKANEPEVGKQFAGWTVNSNNVTLSDENKAMTTFTMPAQAVTVTATYEDIPPVIYTVTVTTDGNGTASADHASAAAGTPVTLTATPNSGYEFDKWVVEAPEELPINGNTFTMPERAVTIKATFVKKAVTPSGGTTYYPDYDTEPTEDKDMCYQVVCRKLNVRSGAGTQYACIDTLTRDTCIIGEMLPSGWVKFTRDDGTAAYVCGQYVRECDCLGNEVLPRTETVVCRTLNVRKGADTQYERVGQLKRGEAVTIVSCGCNGWYKIAYHGGYAWVCSKYVG